MPEVGHSPVTAASSVADGLWSSMSLANFAAHQFTLWASFLIFWCLPLDLLFRLDSFRTALSLWEIIVSTAGLVPMLAAVALILAGGSTTIFLVLRKRGNGRVLHLLVNASSLFVFFLSCYLLARTARIWAKAVDLSFPGSALGVAIVLFVVVAVSGSSPLSVRLDASLRTIRRGLTTAIALAAVIVATRLLVAAFHDQPPPSAIVPPPGERPDIILVTFDAMAAGDMSLYSYHLPTTPNIDEFARQSVTYDHAYSTSNTTPFTVSSMMTGAYPGASGIGNFSPYARIPAELARESLPALLQGAGYRTYAAVALSDFAHPAALGLSRYFDHAPLDYVDWRAVPLCRWPGLLSLALRLYGGLFWAERYGIFSGIWLSEYLLENLQALEPLCGKGPSESFAPPEKVVAGADRLLSEHRQRYSTAPFFLWLHFVQPHVPYLPGSGYRGKFQKDPLPIDGQRSPAELPTGPYAAKDQAQVDRLRLRYDENIAYADGGFGEFVRRLKETDVFDRALVLVASDHGESFSHAYLEHCGPLLTQSLIHIPLLIKLPGGSQAGQRSAALASTVDIPATILAEAGILLPPQARGIPLLDTARHRTAAVSVVPGLAGQKSTGIVSAAIVRPPYKFYYDDRTGKKSLYNLDEDPDESTDRASLDKARAAMMEQELREILPGPSL